jgi:hypothetical protein
MSRIKGLKYGTSTTAPAANKRKLEVVLRSGIGARDQKGGSEEPARQ